MSSGSNCLKLKVPTTFWVRKPAGLGVGYLRFKILKNHEKIKIEKNNSKCHSIIIISYLLTNLSAPVEMPPIFGPSSDCMGRFSCQPSKHVLPILTIKPCMDFQFFFARWTFAKFPIFWGVWGVGTGVISHSNQALKIWKNSWNFFFLKFLIIFVQNVMRLHENHSQTLILIFHHISIKYHHMI